MSLAVPIVLPFGTAGVIVGYALVQSVCTILILFSCFFFQLRYNHLCDWIYLVLCCGLLVQEERER